ncbi:MAG: hypothetical protein HUU20_05350 [Pirellulales bacterium]|nr:hypothetical protein [Pirellulales bacterium]
MNIIILTIGRSGSTIAAKMLCELGWSLAGADEAYAEHVGFRAINSRLVRGALLSPAEASRFLRSLREPWVIKDPRLVQTWRQWKPYLDGKGNLLLWLARDLEAVETSIRKQGWGMPSARGLLLRGRTLGEHTAECQACFDAWSGPRARVAFEDLRKAVLLFDPSRGTHPSSRSRP